VLELHQILYASVYKYVSGRFREIEMLGYTLSIAFRKCAAGWRGVKGGIANDRFSRQVNAEIHRGVPTAREYLVSPVQQVAHEAGREK